VTPLDRLYLAKDKYAVQLKVMCDGRYKSKSVDLDILGYRSGNGLPCFLQVRRTMSRSTGRSLSYNGPARPGFFIWQ